MGFLRKILKKIIKSMGYDLIKKKYVKFSGWGLVSNSYPPWIGFSKNHTFANFEKIEKKIIEKIRNKKFNLTLFNSDNNSFKKNLNIIKGLGYRHYYIYYSSLLAYENTKSRNCVECGVCDGLSIFFNVHLHINQLNNKIYLYDSWSEMRAKDLVKSREKFNIGNYSYLKLENTINNLRDFKNKIVFNKGYIPEVFKKSKNPKKISWLHIDLNASLPTKKALEFFYNKLEKKGVILFDDYAWGGYEDTRICVDNFFKNKKVIFQHLPTGQAIVIKNE